MIGNGKYESRIGSVMTGKYAVLNMGRMGLLIPQYEVNALEPAFDVQYSNQEEINWILIAGRRAPVFCLSENLQPIDKFPPDRHICVLLGNAGGLFGVLCDQVVMFEQTKLEIRSLPQCMHTAETPLRGLVLHGEQVLCVTTTDELLARLTGNSVPLNEAGNVKQLHGGAK